MLRSRMVCLFVVVLIAACSAAAYCQADKVDLKLNLKEGQVFKVRQVSKHSGSGTVGSRTETGAESFSTGMVFTVQKAESDGAYVIKIALDNPTYAAGASSGGDIVGQLNQTVNQALSTLNGRSFTATVTSSGSVRYVEGVNELVSGAIDSLAGQSPLVQQAGRMFLTQSFNEPVLREGLESLFSVLPGRPVEIGERWSRKAATNATGVTKMSDIFCKITSRSGGVSQVKVYEQISTYNVTSPLGLNMQMKGVTEGNIQIDESTGLVTGGTFTSNLSGKSVAVGGKESAPITIVGTTTISRY